MLLQKTEMMRFDTQFHVSAYVPKWNVKQAADLIQATKLQSQWISNFKISSAHTLVSKALAQWLQDTMIHSSKATRGKPSYCPALVNMSYRDFCTPAAFKKRTSIYEGKDLHAYGYLRCLSSDAWNAYANNPFDLSTRKDFLSKISLICMDKMKETTMTPP